jgi:hypothetical protein
MQVVDENLVAGFRLDESNVFKYVETDEGRKLLLLINKPKPVKLGFDLSVRSEAPTAFLQIVWDKTVPDLPVTSSYITLSADAATADPNEHIDQLKLRLSKLAEVDVDLNHQLQATPNDAVGYRLCLQKTPQETGCCLTVHWLLCCSLALSMHTGTCQTGWTSNA